MPARPVTVRWIRRTLVLCALVLAGLWFAVPPSRAAADEFLDPEAAFDLSARAVDDRSVELLFKAAPGYYLYREPFRFVAPDATLGEPVYPPGKVKFDETFQKNVETFRGDVRIVVPVSRAPAEFTLLATSQGCADKGLCYPPADRVVRVRLRAFGGDGSAEALTAAQTAAAAPGPGGAGSPPVASAGPSSPPGDASGLDATLRAGRFWSIVGVFFVAGLLLSLTPCVLPMLPILSSIVVGHGAPASRTRGLALATSYSLGMALVYTALGIAAGLAGEGLAASLQTPWVLGAFAVLLLLLALSMFDVYELQLPAAWTARLTAASQQLRGGRVAAVFAMGALSALIVSPCVAAPLAGALVYLGQTRDVALGGTALFSLAAGMSVPLLVVGASAGALLPRAGAWMTEVKRFFGLILLGVAVWTVRSPLPAALVLGLWGALALSAAVLLVTPLTAGANAGAGRLLRRCVAAVIAACGLLQLVGAASGGSDPLKPLAHLARNGPAAGPTFTPVRSVDELDAAVRDARRPVMLDFYADWCVSCKEMERDTFTDPTVRQRLGGALLLRADVTANTSADRALLKRFDLFGPPGTLFFDAAGREVRNVRVIGFEDAEQFGRSLQAVGL